MQDGGHDIITVPLKKDTMLNNMKMNTLPIISQLKAMMCTGHSANIILPISIPQSIEATWGVF